MKPADVVRQLALVVVGLAFIENHEGAGKGVARAGGRPVAHEVSPDPEAVQEIRYYTGVLVIGVGEELVRLPETGLPAEPQGVFPESAGRRLARERERDNGLGQGPAAGCPRKQNLGPRVVHRRGGGGMARQHPAHGLREGALPASRRTNDPRQAGREVEVGGIGKALESL